MKVNDIKLTSIIPGDINADEKLDISDIVLFQKWLICVPDVILTDWKSADLCEDEVMNVFGLCLMKRKLLEKQG